MTQFLNNIVTRNANRKTKTKALTSSDKAVTTRTRQVLPGKNMCFSFVFWLRQIFSQQPPCFILMAGFYGVMFHPWAFRSPLFHFSITTPRKNPSPRINRPNPPPLPAFTPHPPPHSYSRSLPVPYAVPLLSTQTSLNPEFLQHIFALCLSAFINLLHFLVYPVRLHSQ